MTEDKMNDDTLEEMAVKVIQETVDVANHKVSVTDNQFLIWMKENIIETLRTLRSKTRKEDAKTANKVAKEYDNNWNNQLGVAKYFLECGEEIAQAILKKEEEENENF